MVPTPSILDSLDILQGRRLIINLVGLTAEQRQVISEEEKRKSESEQQDNVNTLNSESESTVTVLPSEDRIAGNGGTSYAVSTTTATAIEDCSATTKKTSHPEVTESSIADIVSRITRMPVS